MSLNLKHIYVSGPWKCPIWFLYRRFINSVRSSEAICCHTPGSTLFQEVACCSMVPSHHQDQCWCIIKCVLQDSMTMMLQDVLMYLNCNTVIKNGIMTLEIQTICKHTVPINIKMGLPFGHIWQMVNLCNKNYGPEWTERCASKFLLQLKNNTANICLYICLCDIYCPFVPLLIWKHWKLTDYNLVELERDL